jgi:hypothetical protein
MSNRGITIFSARSMVRSSKETNMRWPSAASEQLGSSAPVRQRKTNNNFTIELGLIPASQSALYFFKDLFIDSKVFLNAGNYS